MVVQAAKRPNTIWQRVARIIARLGLALVLILAGYLVIYRPLQLHRGATQQEVTRIMPGDEIQPNPIFNATRALTVNATPAQIWPWLLQIGYQRAGWYGYDFLDNAGIASADQIIPELQRMEVGDNVPVWEGVNLKVVAVEPQRYLVWASYDTVNPSSWTIALYPIDATHTRVVWRIRNAPYEWISPKIGPLLFTDLADFVAVRQNLLGLKARAEGVAPEAEGLLKAEVALWTLSLLGLLIAVGWLLIRQDWLLPLLAVSVSGLLTLSLVLLKPPVWVDGLAILGAWVGLGWSILHLTSK